MDAGFVRKGITADDPLFTYSKEKRVESFRTPTARSGPVIEELTQRLPTKSRRVAVFAFPAVL